MRKIFFCLATLMLTMYAQAQKSQFGIKGGLNASRFSVSPSDDGGYKTLFSGHIGFLDHSHQ